MKKLLIGTDCFLPRWDGVARFLNEVIPKLEGKYKIKVLAPKFAGNYDANPDIDIKLFPLTRIMLADYPVCKPSFSSIKKEVKEADIVWVHTLGPIGIMSVLAARRQKKKVIAYIHSIEWELFPKSLKTFKIVKLIIQKISFSGSKYLYNKCDILLVPSKGVAEMLEKKGFKSEKKIVPLGTNTKVFCPPDNKRAAKEAIGIDPDKLVIGYAGRIGNEKDLATLYRAFGRINRKYNSVLLIAGQDLGGVTKAFESNPKVKLFGATNNIVQYLQAMDVYVLSSLTETTSLSTLEAMSCELPVITTNVGSLKEYIKEGFNGMFFGKGNAYELAKKTDYLLKNEHIRKIMGQNARRTIIDKFSWEKTMKEINEVLDKL